MIRNIVAALCALIVLAGCGTSKISMAPVAGTAKHQVKTVAFMPGGGLLADAVGVELANRGMTVIDSASTSSLMVRLNLNEVEITRPEGLAKLAQQGIDAVLIVRAGAGEDRRPESASARMNSTTTGQMLAGVTWQNGWGGAPGSPADRTMRKGTSEAATEIAQALISRVR